MTRWLLPLAAVALACTSASQATDGLRARVTPAPAALTTDNLVAHDHAEERRKAGGGPARADDPEREARRSFAPRRQRTRRVSRPRHVPFQRPLVLEADRGEAGIANGSIAVSASLRFELPYDLAVLGRRDVLFLDRGRILRLDPRTHRVSLYATTPSRELIAMERLDDGTLFVTDFPANRILRVDPAGRSSVVAQVAAPADLVVDPTGRTIWVASIAPGVGVVRVDVATGRVEPFANVESPHGIDRDAAGNFYVHDGHVISRIDGISGAVTPFADVDGIKLLAAPDGSLYGVVGGPAGGRVIRVAPDGTVTTVAGKGGLGPPKDGPALEVGMLPNAVQLAPDGSLIVTQSEPIPALRRVDRPGGTITTLARGDRR